MIAQGTDSMDDLDSLSDLAMLEDLYNRLWGLIEARSIAYADDPIGKTGLYSRTHKIRGTLEHPVVCEEYVLDHKLINGLRKLGKHIAIQTGQWRRSKGTDTNAEMMEIVTRKLAAGRDRVAREKVARDAAEAAKRETQPEERLGK
jgi:hypothetical protein